MRAKPYLVQVQRFRLLGGFEKLVRYNLAKAQKAEAGRADQKWSAQINDYHPPMRRNRIRLTDIPRQLKNCSQEQFFNLIAKVIY